MPACACSAFDPHVSYFAQRSALDLFQFIVQLPAALRDDLAVRSLDPHVCRPY